VARPGAVVRRARPGDLRTASAAPNRRPPR
jgi:hypothetical protein